jgi:hypothetical protein
VRLRDAARRLKPSAQRQNNKPVISSNFRLDVNGSKNTDSADVTLTPETKSEAVTVIKRRPASIKLDKKRKN